MQQTDEKRRDLERLVGTALGTAIAAVVFIALAFTIFEGTVL